MIVVDSTFVVDYLDGIEETKSILAEYDDQPMHVPSLVLFEVARGVLKTADREVLDAVLHRLEWLDVLPLSAAEAVEAAHIEAELLEGGEPINLGDTLIAGSCRHRGASLLTRDGDFDRILNLEVITY